MENIEGGYGRTLIFGPSRSGKSTWLIRILFLLIAVFSNFELTVISPTAESDSTWTAKAKKIVTKYYKAINALALKRLNNVINRSKRDKKFHIIVLDDLGDDAYMRHNRNNNPIQQLAMGAVQRRTHIIGVFHRINQPTTVFRDNAENIICTKLRNSTQLRMFEQEFLSGLTPDETKRLEGMAWREPFDVLCIKRLPGGVEKYYRNLTEEIVVGEEGFN